MNREKNKVVKPVKISERLVYFVIIIGLVGFAVYQTTKSSTLKQENNIALQKNEVLNRYTLSLDQIIKEKEGRLGQLRQADTQQKLQIQEQIEQLKQKKREIQELKKARQVDFQKLIKISADLEQMHQKDEALLARLASLKENTKQKKPLVNRPNLPNRQEHKDLQAEYGKLKAALEQALKENTELSGQLFATHFVVTPGEIKKGHFSPSTRARRTTHLKVGFTLTRSLKSGESIVLDLYNDGEVLPVMQVYSNELKVLSGNRVTMNVVRVGGKPFRKGNNVLNIYRMHEGVKSKIGSHVVYLR
ncbi:hypothetical protein [Microscilla marina]|uniref:Uncharacterized protein n=1 Tax=Microscilla marina ATCC 23134 TaxID=313606 RepID=A1ZWI2_MICM2|nr:hypothetical protein [Microscilla marina]EAY25222.1 hypothetical protein M23134_07959 [Microscilla marina ATCC 23134]